MNQLTVEVVRVLDTTVSGANDFKSHGTENEQYPKH
jgi:hypothetical protein